MTDELGLEPDDIRFICTDRGRHRPWVFDTHVGSPDVQTLVGKEDPDTHARSDEVEAAHGSATATRALARKGYEWRYRASFKCKRCGRHYQYKSGSLVYKLTLRAMERGVSDVDLSYQE